MKKQCLFIAVALLSSSSEFAQAGAYTINVFGADGTLVQQNRLTAEAGSVVNVAISGKPGMYIVSVAKDGKQCKAVRVVKK